MAACPTPPSAPRGAEGTDGGLSLPRLGRCLRRRLAGCRKHKEIDDYDREAHWLQLGFPGSINFQSPLKEALLNLLKHILKRSSTKKCKCFRNIHGWRVWEIGGTKGSTSNLQGLVGLCSGYHQVSLDAWTRHAARTVRAPVFIRPVTCSKPSHPLGSHTIFASSRTRWDSPCWSESSWML